MGDWKGPEEKRHELTNADRAKGGKVVSERKKLANALRPLKHGKNAKALAAAGFEFCDGCAYRDSCVSYKPGQACQLRVQILRQLNEVGGPEGSKAWLNVMLRGMQDLYVLSKTSDDSTTAMQKYMDLWIKMGKVLFPQRIQVTTKDQEIRIVFGKESEDGKDNKD